MAELTRALGVFAALWISLAGCATGRAHENFKSIMDGNVGRNMYDSYVFRSRNKNLFVAKRQLPNGNIEEEFRAGRGPTCRVYFESNEKTEKIVAWRYVGTEEDCSVVP